MDKRAELLGKVLADTHDSLLLEMGTGIGKTRMSIEKARQWGSESILILVPTIVLKGNWREEIAKWWPDAPETIDTVCHASLGKCRVDKYDTIIFDEAHHLTLRARELMDRMRARHHLFLTATLTGEEEPVIREWLDKRYGISTIRETTSAAIRKGLLPTPRVFMLGYELDDTTRKDYVWWFEKYEDVTEAEMYDIINDDIDSDDEEERMKIKCTMRLKWLASLKKAIAIDLIARLHDRRTLVFCNTIDQTESLGVPCVNSRSKEAAGNLRRFNDHEIGHIAACNMLDEGINLASCQVGLFIAINASTRKQVQRVGRILRHAQPWVIFAYFKGTREERIIRNMVYGHDPVIDRSHCSWHDETRPVEGNVGQMILTA